uniref:Uncharacterized protein n=2 Tax=Rhizophora mucronata TaxID=61149 RepID=A0A2P2MWL9_RHIMU
MLRSQAVVGVCNLCAFSINIIIVIITTTSLVGIAKAQSQTTNATTDPTEARIINSMFQTWGITASSVQQQGWNISGEPCSGAALGDSPTIGDFSYNPGIKCNCSFQSSTVCHITAL